MVLGTLIASSFLLIPVEQSLDTIHSLETTSAQKVQIYLIRHGESVHHAKSKEDGISIVTGKSIPIPLSKEGREQAEMFAKKLIRKLPLDQTYVLLSSTARRAQETANIIFDQLKDICLIERGDSYENLLEIGEGSWEGKPKDEEYKLAKRAWEKLSAKEKYSIPMTDTAESYKEVAERALRDLQEIVNQHPQKTLFIVTHFVTMNALALRLSSRFEELSEEPGSPLPQKYFFNCDLLSLELEENKPIDNATVRMYVKSEIGNS